MEKEKEVVEKTTKKELNLNESIIKIRVDLQNSKIKKSGMNKFAGFSYYELSDFLPKLNELMMENGVNDVFTIDGELCSLNLLKGAESNTYEIPFTQFSTPLNKSGLPSMQDIQYLGALNTYYKRYLYLNAFGITDGEVIDGMNNDDIKQGEQKPKSTLATEKQISMITSMLGDKLQNVLTSNGLEKVEDLTVKQASDLISRLKGNK